MQSRVPYLLGLLLLVIIGAWLRVGPALSLPMWFDEADTWRSGIIDPKVSGWSLETGQYEPVPMVYGKFFRWENHFETAPLTFLLARISTDILGTTDPWAMRMPSLLAGLLCIPAAYWLGRVVRDQSLGLMTAAIITFDPSQVDQSQQCRIYTVLMLLMLLAMALTIKLVREPEPGMRNINDNNESGNNVSAKCDAWLTPVWQWVLLGGLLGLLLSTTQFALAVWVGIAAGTVGLMATGVILKKPHPKTRQVAVGITCAFAVACMLTNVGIHSVINRVFHGGGGDRPDLTYFAMAREIVVSAKDLINLTPAGLIMYLFAAIGHVLLFKKCKTSTAVLLGVAVMNVLMLFSFLRIHHFMDIRYLSPLQPALYIGLAMFATGLAQVMLKRIAMGIIILFLCIQCWQSLNLTQYYMQPDRYHFTRAILEARDAIKPGETMSIYPGVACILGQYYQCPQDPSLFTAQYDLTTHLPVEKPAVPANLKATGVRMVLGMYNHETPNMDQKNKRTAAIKRLADHFGVTVEQAQLDEHLKRDRVATAYITRSGVTLTSVGVE